MREQRVKNMIRIEHSVLSMCATNVYYVFDDATGKGFIIDPADNAQAIISKVDRLSFTPEAILITHGHFDHILALDEIREHYGIKAYAGATEKAVLTSPIYNLTDAFMGQPYTTEADVYLADGEEFNIAGMKIKAIEIPGHTIGGMCYYIADENVIFTGDTLFCESVGRSDFPSGNGALLCRSIKEKLFVLPENTVVYPGHMDETTIGSEIQYNPFCQ